jgi:hypothetical protein
MRRGGTLQGGARRMHVRTWQGGVGSARRERRPARACQLCPSAALHVDGFRSPTIVRVDPVRWLTCGRNLAHYCFGWCSWPLSPVLMHPTRDEFHLWPRRQERWAVCRRTADRSRRATHERFCVFEGRAPVRFFRAQKVSTKAGRGAFLACLHPA